MIVLYDYWRSSSAYRVRIALNLLGLEYQAVSVDLRTGAQKTADYSKKNPQSFVPLLEIDGLKLTQSLAIIGYLQDKYDADFIPEEPILKAKILQFAYIIAMDIQPVCNLSVINYVAELANGDNESVKQWMQDFMQRGLKALEATIAERNSLLCFTDTPSLAEICLMPQIYNATRWQVPMENYPQLAAVAEECQKLAAFQKAYPQEPSN